MFKDNMKNILKRCHNGNIFSLTKPVDYKISQQQANRALTLLKNNHKEYLLKEYEKYKNQLLPFEQLYNDIYIECIQYKEKYNGDIDDFEYSLICDEVGETTKYKEPFEFFWHFYHFIGMEIDNEILLNKYIKCSNYKENLDILESQEYCLLKSYVIKDEISFITHCSEGPLSQTIYFELNEETKKWLLQFKHYYDINGYLQDLAIYQNNDIVFSSCTHERIYLYS